MIAAPDTSLELRTQLETVQRVREYAESLGLTVDEQYTDYVAWPGDRILTTLVVAVPGEVEPRPFRFPVLGDLPYKGFFDQDRAEKAAEEFRSDGFDTCLIPVRAYSTLGFFSDPITDPMLSTGQGRTVETVLHELVHATVFVDDDAQLNESAASFIGQEASVEFFRSDPELYGKRRVQVDESLVISAQVLEFRERVRTLYESSSTLEPAALLDQRRRAEEETRSSLRALPLTQQDPERLAKYIRLNDACLALRGTYSADIQLHQRVFVALDGDLPAFIDRLQRAAQAEDPRAAFFAVLDEGSAP